MGQIAACLTDLICLIEQRDAFGFTSPSKAADSASVKKEGGKKKEKTPHTTSTAIDTHIYSFRRVYLVALNILFIALPPALFRSSACNKDHKAGKSVNCHCH